MRTRLHRLPACKGHTKHAHISIHTLPTNREQPTQTFKAIIPLAKYSIGNPITEYTNKLLPHDYGMSIHQTREMKGKRRTSRQFFFPTVQDNLTHSHPPTENPPNQNRPQPPKSPYPPGFHRPSPCAKLSLISQGVSRLISMSGTI